MHIFRINSFPGFEFPIEWKSAQRNDIFSLVACTTYINAIDFFVVTFL